MIPVTTGVENDLNVEVFSDMLQEGDNIVVTPTPDLAEGTLVTTPEMMQQMDTKADVENPQGNIENNTDENTQSDAENNIDENTESDTESDTDQNTEDNAPSDSIE